MSTNVNDINKIYCNSPITIKKTNVTSLLFVDNKVVSKSRYSVVDHYINLLEPANENVSFYQHRGVAQYYEFHKDLTAGNIIISGLDIFNNNLTGLTASNNLVFINGYKLLPAEYTLANDGNSITIITPIYTEKVSTIIIYRSDNIQYMGNIENADNWDLNKHSFTLNDYSCLNYLFFKNGELLTRDLVTKVNDTVTINTDIRTFEDSETNEKRMLDIIEYYHFPIDTESVVFDGMPGYLSYGPYDNLNFIVPETYDTEVIFQTIVKYAIDDVRKGFFIREKDGDGCLMITGENFETNIAYCTSIVDFSNIDYTKDEYFVQVPEARSIIKYISEYDLNRMLMPEILGSFQRLLLDETYDSVQRLKNIRSINNVDSSQITNFIKFLGLDINVTGLSINKKHALLEELTNFYNVVGTRESYNFYNVMTNNSKIVDITQLFTPIRDYIDSETLDSAKRYIDFRTAEELGAVTHKRYDFQNYDLGSVDQLANPSDSFTNQPRDIGVLVNPDELPILSNSRQITYVFGKIDENDIKNILNEKNEIIAKIDTTDTTLIGKNILDLNNNIIGIVDCISETDTTRLVIIKQNISVPTNIYITNPTTGPNQAAVDLGKIINLAESFYDFGSVSEVIKGHWVEWTEWDRPKNWYPTNHVEVAVQIPADIDYATFMTEFKNTFYNIASAVLYIHSIIEVYVFGKENPWDTDDDLSNGGANFGMVTVPIYYSIESSVTNDPARQDYRYD